MKQTISSAAFADTKPHYELLDGLRGVAALMVVWHHVFEGFATSPVDQGFNHGYLAVDFFFILSGFVIGYAYDDRWKTLRIQDFFQRRWIRLHPMVVMGAVLGMLTFCGHGRLQWDGTQVAMPMVWAALLLHCFLLPVAPGMGAEVRGNGEMYPLNGPAWSLFFEYIGNILYALCLRRLSTKALLWLVGLSGTALALFVFFDFSGYEHLGVGWTLAAYNFPGGLLRMLFSYAAGLAISRVFRPLPVRGAFWLCTLVLFGLFSVPYAGGSGWPWVNGLFDCACVLFVFPALVCLAASGKTTDKVSAGVCRFLGDISYPLYMVHYPFMYLFYAWVWDNGLSFGQTWPVAVGLFVGNILLAYACLKMYDEPVRKWLGGKFLVRKGR